MGIKEREEREGWGRRKKEDGDDGVLGEEEEGEKRKKPKEEREEKTIGEERGRERNQIKLEIIRVLETLIIKFFPLWYK